jgi:exodeoxyribonuclease VII small subunit
MPLSPNKSPESGRSFEVAFRELQQVVEQLEDGGLELERAVQLFERGTELARACERIVDEAELRVTRLPAESASALSDAPVETD